MPVEAEQSHNLQYGFLLFICKGWIMSATGNKNKNDWTIDGFLKHISRLHDCTRSFAFILGAGASKSSGIPTGAEIVKDILDIMYEQISDKNKPETVEEWATAETLDIENFDYGKKAEFYPDVFERFFASDRDLGMAYLEKQIIGKRPNFGYIVLACILAKTRHNVVITTNFDNLVADALSIYTHSYPLVCGHEVLASVVSFKTKRRCPLIVKIHRDLLLDPINDRENTEKMAEEWKCMLKNLLKDYTPIVLGYGGNDGSLMGFLEDISPKDIPGGIFWCYRSAEEPNDRIKGLVKKHPGALIAIDDFDEMMKRIGVTSGLSLINEAVLKEAIRKVEKYRENVVEVLDYHKKTQSSSTNNESIPNKTSISKRQPSTLGQPTYWWIYELNAREETNVESKIFIYQEGFRKFKNRPELGCKYAELLASQHGKQSEAEEEFNKLFELNPRNAEVCSRFAYFLETSLKNYERAEELYNLSIQYNPENCNYYEHYSAFCHNHRNFLKQKYPHTQASKVANISVEDLIYQIGKRLFPEAKSWTIAAWDRVDLENIQAVVEVLLYRGLVARLENKDDTPALGRLKFCLAINFKRLFSWDIIDVMFEAKKLERLSDDDYRLYYALVATILDQAEVPHLNSEPRWLEINSISLTEVWDD